MPYERSNIQRLEAYAPGEQPQTQQVVKLNTNENPYPPAPQVLEAIRQVSAESLRRYPPPRADRFRQTAARVHGLTPQQVIATNGGDELLRLAVTVFCEPASPGQTRGGVGTAEPSYSLYPVLAAIHNTPLTRVPLREDFSLPEDFADRLNDAGCRLAFIVNPHAPSGRLQPLEELERIARRFKGVLLIDEAYVDFARRDALPLLDPASGIDNVLILRSLSKGYSLAGLRFGYGLGHPDLIAALDKARDSYNTDVLAQAAAVAALEHRQHAQATWRQVIAQRDRLTESLRQQGWSVYPSQTNFLLAAPPPSGPDARSLYESLKARGIFVRYFDQDRLRDKLRITIGTPEQNDALIEALAALTSQPQP
ncbi:MAG TPA: histidinol-phosphate transaminase [Phycisphaeraceae bacterium]